MKRTLKEKKAAEAVATPQLGRVRRGGEARAGHLRQEKSHIEKRKEASALYRPVAQVDNKEQSNESEKGEILYPQSGEPVWDNCGGSGVMGVPRKESRVFSLACSQQGLGARKNVKEKKGDRQTRKSEGRGLITRKWERESEVGARGRGLFPPSRRGVSREREGVQISKKNK